MALEAQRGLSIDKSWGLRPGGPGSGEALPCPAEAGAERGARGSRSCRGGVWGQASGSCCCDNCGWARRRATHRLDPSPNQLDLQISSSRSTQTPDGALEGQSAQATPAHGTATLTFLGQSDWTLYEFFKLRT